jgi:hypothetical protein
MGEAGSDARDRSSEAGAVGEVSSKASIRSEIRPLLTTRRQAAGDSDRGVSCRRIGRLGDLGGSHAGRRSAREPRHARPGRLGPINLNEPLGGSLRSTLRLGSCVSAFRWIDG